MKYFWKIGKLQACLVLLVFLLSAPLSKTHAELTTGSCAQNGRPENHHTCYWEWDLTGGSNSGWFATDSSCDENHQLDSRCLGSDPNAFVPPGNARTTVCVPCALKNVVLKKHGDVCILSNECSGGFTCRNSAIISGQKRCLWPMRTAYFADACFVEEFECQPTDTGPRGNPGSGFGDAMVCGNAQQGQMGKCVTTGVSNPECTNDAAGDLFCQQKLGNPNAYCDTVTCILGNPPLEPTSLTASRLCQFTRDKNITDENKDQRYQSCKGCVGLDNQNGNKMWTAIGCINVSPQGFVENLLKFAIGIAGGIAFLMIVYGGFTVMTSAGNPEKLTSGKEIITSAIAGLLLIVFSTIILKIIGVDILKIPGLT